MAADLAARDADFLVLNDLGEHVYRFSGQAQTQRDTICIEGVHGGVLCMATVRAMSTRDRVAVTDGEGSEICAVVRTPASPLRDSFSIVLRNGDALQVDGNLQRHEYAVVGPSGTVARVSPRWFRARGTYGVEIMNDQQAPLLLTSIAVLDHMIQRSSPSAGRLG